MATCVYAENGFSDVKPTDWFYEHIANLYNEKIVNGISKTEYAPNQTLNYNEYLKMIVVTITGKELTAKDGEEWDTPYINKAYDLGLIPDKNQKFLEPIIRYEMARIALLGLEKNNKDYSRFKDEIKDFKNIPQEYQDIVLRSYGEDLIKGLGDGRFGGSETMTRGMAATVVNRLWTKIHEKGTNNKPITVSMEKAKKLQKDEDIIAVMNKYKFGYMGLGANSVMYDFKGLEESDFIEPIICIQPKDRWSWFTISLANANEYLLAKEEYFMKIECITYPEFSTNISKEWTSLDLVAWSLSCSLERNVKEGEKLVYEVSIKNNKKIKAYQITLIVGAGLHD